MQDRFFNSNDDSSIVSYMVMDFDCRTVSKLIFGCGYLGSRVARRWYDAGHGVEIVTRSRENARQLEQEGYATIIRDLLDPQSLRSSPTVSTVLFSVGYNRSEKPPHTIEDVYAGGMRNVLASLPEDTGRLIYISTTGVYGPTSGESVDETSPPDPQRDGGRASLAAEELLAEHPLGKRSVVLRLAGIYGPGRVPSLNELIGGQPIPARSNGYLNLIHVDDAASVVVAAAELPAFNDGPRVYCVSDGHPVVRGEYYNEVARQIGAPQPRFVEPEPNSPRAARAESSRRVRNDRMVAELGVALRYPDYRAGLAAILNK